MVRGKKGRSVPILFSKSMRAQVNLLLEMRDAAGVGSSEYIFVNSMSQDRRPLRGCDCLRKFAKLSGMKHPEALTSTKLRKHIATMSQVLNLQDNELDLLASFLGHDIRVHRDVYRMPESTTRLAMVSNLLMASEEGLGNWRGKRPAQITPPEPSSSDHSSHEQGDGSGESLGIDMVEDRDVDAKERRNVGTEERRCGSHQTKKKSG